MNRNRFLAAPELFWAGLSVFASTTIEHEGSLSSFLHNRWYLMSYGLCFIVTLALSVRNVTTIGTTECEEGRVGTFTTARHLVRIAVFYIIITALTLFWRTDIARILILAIGLVYFSIVTIIQRRKP